MFLSRDRILAYVRSYAWVLLGTCFFACEGSVSLEEDPTIGEEDSSTTEVTAPCVDLDGDGYGFGCERGDDCDDQDNRVASECGPPKHRTPCEPDSTEKCFVIKDIDEEGYQCAAGTRHCYAGIWGVCEEESGFTVTAESAALITGPTRCNPCNPQCAITTDDPDGADLNTDPDSQDQNAEDVVFDASKGGVTLAEEGGSGLGEDTDGDGVPDRFEPPECVNDPACDGFSENGEIFHVLPFGSPTVIDPLDINIQLRTADIYFLMDTTESMQDEIDNLRTSLVSGNLISNPERCGLESQLPVTSKWTGQYFANRDLSGTPTFTKEVDVIDFNWGSGGPTNPSGESFNTDDFSVRWTGTITLPADGPVEFLYDSDDGIRIYIDGSIFVDEWVFRGMSAQPFSRTTGSLSAGVHTVVVEHFEGTGGAGAIAKLAPPPAPAGYEGLIGAIRCEIPNTAFGVGYFDDLPYHAPGQTWPYGDPNYYDAPTNTPHDVPFYNLLNLTPSDEAADRTQIFDSVSRLVARYGGDWPESHIPALYSLATGAGVPDSEHGTYSTPAEEQVPLYDMTGVVTEAGPPFAGPVEIDCSGPTEWTGEYFNKHKNVSGTPNMVRVDPQIDFNWGNGGPGGGIGNNRFSVRWTGTWNVPVAGRCTLRTRTDDGVRAYLDGNRIINKWRDQGPTTYTASMNLSAGSHTIVIQYYENGGGAVAEVDMLTESVGVTAEMNLGDITGQNKILEGNSSGASSTNHNTACSASRDAPDVRFYFSLTSRTALQFSTEGSDYNTTLTLYRADNSRITCNDDASGIGNRSRFERTLDPGDYYVVIDGDNGSDSGDYRLSIASAIGEDQATAYDLGDLTNTWRQLSGTTDPMRDDYSNGSCFGGNSTSAEDAVFKFTLSQKSHIVITSEGTSFNNILRLYNESFSELYCNNGNNGNLDGDIASIFQELDAGTYYFMIEGSNGDDGNYKIGVGAWPDNSAYWTPPSAGCNPGDFGYPCFREGTIPVALLFTDASMHNNARNTGERYALASPAYHDAVYALRAKGIKVIGIHSGSASYLDCNRECLRTERRCEDRTRRVCVERGPRERKCRTRCQQGGCFEECWWEEPCIRREDEEYEHCWNECVERAPEVCERRYRGGEPDLRAVASATGAVDPDGNPMVYQINSDGTGLSGTVVEAIARLAGFSRMDITLRVNDDVATGVDERNFVESIAAVPSAEANARCLGTFDTWFQKCLPGTDVNFNVGFRNDVVAASNVDQYFNFTIDVMGDGLYVLESIPVTIVVPKDGAKFPDEGKYWRNYDSGDYCSPGLLPIWEEVTWSATLPSDTSIRWELRLAETCSDPDDLNACTELNNATPIAWTAPPTSSPMNIEQAIRDAGQPIEMPYARLTAILRASSDKAETPVLHDFQMQYSCEARD